MSCPSSSFCELVSDTGYAARFNGHHWLVPVPADPASALVALSCASSSFCVALDAKGRSVEFNGRTWSHPVTVAAGVVAISCPTSLFCMAVDRAGHVYSYNGHKWQAAGSDGNAGGWSYVSCTSTTFCAEVTSATKRIPSEDTAVTYDGKDWSSPHVFDSNYNGVLGVSCSSRTFCAALDSENGGAQINAYFYNGTSWRGGPAVTPAPQSRRLGVTGATVAAQRPNAISCSSRSFCFYVDGSVYNGSKWS